MTLQIPDALFEATRSGKLIPFIGAGFSRPFGFPSYSELIDEIALEAGFDPQVARKYGDYMQLAEYHVIKNHGFGSLRRRLDKKFSSDKIDISTSECHLLLPELNAKKIYTTNWDELIEHAFLYKKKDHKKIIRVADFDEAGSNDTCVIKFHGDFDDDNTIVFTESQFFDRLGFASENFLDHQLKTDMGRHTILFMGYSLSDLNMRFLCYKMNKIIPTNERGKRGKTLAYIVLAEPNPVFEKLCIDSRGLEVILLDPSKPTESLADLLYQLVKHAPASVSITTQ